MPVAQKNRAEHIGYTPTIRQSEIHRAETAIHGNASFVPKKATGKAYTLRAFFAQALSLYASRRALSLARVSGLMREAMVFFFATLGVSSRRASS